MVKRLTEWNEFGNADIIALRDMMPEIYAELSFGEANALTEALNRIALRDMMPEIYAELSFGEANALTEALNRLAAYEDATPLERAQELAKAEKDGRLVVLPCKPDASAYQWKRGDDIPSLFRFYGVTISEDGEITYQTHWGETFKSDDFGKTVFLTREEAEAALKKREEA